MREKPKIRSVTELAKYRIGDVMWWVILRSAQAVPELPEDDEWMRQHHPKALYTWGPRKVTWGKAMLPKLQHIDFGNIVGLLTSKIIVDQFPICDIVRSHDTGEFFYSNDNDEWMPESMLLETQPQATKEKRRILRLLQRWLANQ